MREQLTSSRLLTGALCALLAGWSATAERPLEYYEATHTWVAPSVRGLAPGTEAPVADEVQTDPRALGQVTVVDSFPFPAGWLFARDIAWDTSSLWIGENFNSRIYEIDPATGTVLFSFPAPDENPWGLTFDGLNLINATISTTGSPPDTLPDDVFVLTTGGGVLATWPPPDSPNADPHGCAFDPGTGSLWLSDSRSDTIYELDPANGNVLSSFPSPSPDMRGLTFDGQFLWGVDHAGLSLMRFDFSGDVQLSLSIATLGDDPEGLTTDGAFFWVTENQTDTIYKIDLGLDIFADGFESGDTSAWSNTVP